MGSVLSCRLTIIILTADCEVPDIEKYLAHYVTLGVPHSSPHGIFCYINIVVSINEVLYATCARLILQWLTVCRQVNHLGMSSLPGQLSLLPSVGG